MQNCGPLPCSWLPLPIIQMVYSAAGLAEMGCVPALLCLPIRVVPARARFRR